jgi:hypothetical protein
VSAQDLALLTVLSAVAGIIAAAATALTVFVGIRQLSEGRRLANEKYARDAWTSYLKVAFDHPEFGYTDLALAHSKQKTVQGMIDSGELHCERYLWFFTILLDSSERILEYLPTKDWEDAVVSQLRYHKAIIQVVWFGKEDPWEPYYSKALNRLVTERIGLLPPPGWVSNKTSADATSGTSLEHTGPLG